MRRGYYTTVLTDEEPSPAQRYPWSRSLKLTQPEPELNAGLASAVLLIVPFAGPRVGRGMRAEGFR